ncbi:MULTISPECIES: alpha/beta hydrolase [unclassified Streptomyces]|uniref:alpha/beta hydrolase n=1 Tax=unclassified Streptomyces TaxID=2593676 RepID=UPI00225BDFCD|nr:MULTISPECIES: alpha/beta hydrolase [unclassified Streptomyces]MCX4528683.1 alpha/beta hydrolase [Streptomyces sp. NBC_01551]MCX4540710.1 alpha/beta hydrolase [Streptomyces sp. NBC_01565]
MRTPPVHSALAATALTLALALTPPPPAAAGPTTPTATSSITGPKPIAGPGAGAGTAAGTGHAAAGTPPGAGTGAEDAGAEVVARRAAAVGGRALGFRPCPAGEGLPAPVRCATLRVPLDYARPDGPQISLTVSRVTATGGAARQGSLVFNPGGPGASGMYFPLLADRPAWRRIAAAYDLVGYAPRGVGRSAPLSCQDPAARAKAPTQVPAEPSPAYKQERVAAARAYALGCARRAGAALPYYTTLNNARDLHVLRAALGEPKLTFMGASYGTYFGAVYATLYPRHVRRMVFDSAVDPDPRRVWYRNNLAQAPAFERRWYDFRAWAARHHAAYRLGATPAAVQASHERVRAAVARIPAAGLVGTGELRAAALQAAYYDDAWPDLAAALSAFLDGDPDPLAALAGPGPHGPAEAENATAVYTAVLCNDAPWPADWETWDRDNTELARRAPLETWANAFTNLPCAYWPVAGRLRQRPVDVGSQPTPLPPTLIVAAERDGATPYPGALELLRRLGPAAALVTEAEAGTHGVAGGRNECVDLHVERYILTGDTPGRSVTCAPHPEPAPVSLDDRAAGTLRVPLPPVV